MIETCELTPTMENGTELVPLKEYNVEREFGTRPKNTKSWYLDTGASNHMTGCEDVFTNIDKSVKGSVKFGDGSVVEIHGRGAVLIKAANEEHKVLTGSISLLASVTISLVLDNLMKSVARLSLKMVFSVSMIKRESFWRGSRNHETSYMFCI